MIAPAIALKRFAFLGHEFLAWLLWHIDDESVAEAWSLSPNNGILLQRETRDGMESISIRGSLDGKSAEIRAALAGGYYVESVNMELLHGDLRYSLTFWATQFGFSRTETPPTAPVLTEDELEGAIVEKIGLLERAFAAVDRLYHAFLQARVDPGAWEAELDEINKWIETGVARAV